MPIPPRKLLACPSCGVHGFLDAAAGTMTCPACGDVSHVHLAGGAATCAYPGICRVVGAALLTGAALAAGCETYDEPVYGAPAIDVGVGAADAVPATQDADSGSTAGD
ncbi:MAG: hypothetical protein H6747_12340 [Deltaproteobacteria bacterium]|nr:hypothetical protein [Deltaproteobacteria bacterium]